MRQLLATLVLATAIGPAFAAMQTRAVEWKVGEEEFRGVLVFDDAGMTTRPGRLQHGCHVHRILVGQGRVTDRPTGEEPHRSFGQLRGQAMRHLLH